MKTFTKIAIGAAVIIGILALLGSLILPLVKDEIYNILGSLFTPSTEAPMTEGDRTLVEIPYHVYMQDPESGEYQLKSSTKEYLTVGESKTFIAPEIEHYTVNTDKSRLIIAYAEEGKKLLLYYDCETCKVSFAIGDAELESGSAFQTLRKGQTPKAPVLTKKGYTLKGFDKPIEKVYEDTVYTPAWEITKYVLRLHATDDTLLPGSAFTKREDTDGCFEATYTFKDSLNVPKPSSDGYTFIEWNTAPDGSGKTVSSIAEGTYQSTTLYAIYTVKLYSISFAAVDSISYPAYYLPYGSDISSPYIAPENQKAGYGLTWYTDVFYTEPYEFHKMPKENITLYGRWEEDTGSGFLSWDPQTFAAKETIDSLNELIDFIDFVRFHNLTEAIRVEVTYADYMTLKNDVAKAETLGEFRTSGSISYTTGNGALTKVGAKSYLSIRVANTFRDVEASKTTDKSDEKAYTLLTPAITPRGDGYTAFYIDALTKRYPVSTSNQLMYVVEHGYAPLCEEGSAAEEMFLSAKALLNTILPENASDLEKVELIYNYLITAIQYDNGAVKIANESPDSWPEYDAFFLEGVFRNKKAVCDGIAKAFSLLCNIEGIPCIEVVGTGHAWNRVKVNNLWYVVDATFGNLHLPERVFSIADHSYFLVSDAEKEADGYRGINYLTIIAKKNFGYYDNKEITHNNRSFDYVIDSTEELARLLEYAVSLSDDLNESTINFVYKISLMDFAAACRAAQQTLRFRGVTIDCDITYYGSGYNSVYKLVFKS